MILDKATVLTILVTIVDDTMKGSAVIQEALRWPGRAPQLSDNKLVIIAGGKAVRDGPKAAQSVPQIKRNRQCSVVRTVAPLQALCRRHLGGADAIKVTAHGVAQ